MASPPGQLSHGTDSVAGPARALAVQRVHQRPVLLEDVVALEGRRLVPIPAWGHGIDGTEAARETVRTWAWPSAPAKGSRWCAASNWGRGCMWTAWCHKPGIPGLPWPRFVSIETNRAYLAPCLPLPSPQQPPGGHRSPRGPGGADPTAPSSPCEPPIFHRPRGQEFRAAPAATSRPRCRPNAGASPGRPAPAAPWPDRSGSPWPPRTRA
jgi:hypothetical protein